jgi:predicted XRE-type DNA-binding protein
MALRMELSLFITDCIKKLGLKQVEAAAKLNIPQSRVSELTNGNIEKFTVDAMMDMLDKLGFRTHVTLPSNDAGASPRVVVTQSPAS